MSKQWLTQRFLTVRTVVSRREWTRICLVINLWILLMEMLLYYNSNTTTITTTTTITSNLNSQLLSFKWMDRWWPSEIQPCTRCFQDRSRWNTKTVRKWKSVQKFCGIPTWTVRLLCIGRVKCWFLPKYYEYCACQTSDDFIRSKANWTAFKNLGKIIFWVCLFSRKWLRLNFREK